MIVLRGGGMGAALTTKTSSTDQSWRPQYRSNGHINRVSNELIAAIGLYCKAILGWGLHGVKKMSFGMNHAQGAG